jgi:hypothetical protein
MKQRVAPTHGPAARPAAPPRATTPAASNSARAGAIDERLQRAAAQASAGVPHRERLESTFGLDLGHLRVVLGGDEVADALAERNAEAVAFKDTLLFADANPAPELVAHEVTHALQQEKGGAGGGESEAEAGARALGAGESFEVKGGAAEKPQFSTSKAASSKGSVKLTMAGSPVSPPAVTGLDDVHDFLMANQAALAGWSGTIRVRFSGTVKQRAQVIWAYYAAGQTLEIEGADGAVVSGFTGSGDKQVATEGYFLAYRPIVPQAMSADNPAAANFSMHGLTVRGFVSGGVEISPRSGQLPSAEQYASDSYDAEAGHGDGGLTAFLSGASIKGNTFEQMGTSYMKRGTERYAPTDPEGYKYAGFGGIVARGLNASTISGNTFSDLTNRDSSKRSEADGREVSWEALMHGIYLRDHSSNDSIRNNTFDTISGAAVKFTNASDHNKVRDNKADNTGSDAFVLEHYSANNPGGMAESDSRGYGSKGVSKAADRRKYIDGNQAGTSYDKNKKLKEFKEKKVKG